MPEPTSTRSYRRTEPYPRIPFESRLAPQPNGCILWTGGSDGRAYGQLQVNGRMIHALRFAWERVNGPIPAGLHVLHLCDTPRCCNVAHLKLGTHSDNMMMMAMHDRVAGRKLTNEQVRAIKARLSAGETCSQIAPDFGVHASTIDAIRSGDNWRHVK